MREASPALDTPLRNYQYDGAEWIMNRLNAGHKAVLLADPAGLGKTVQALTAASWLLAQRILIICPAGARRVWENEIDRWFAHWLPRVLMVEPGFLMQPQIRRRLSSEPLILIVGYDEFSFGTPIATVLDYLGNWDLCIIDECHYLKADSKRTKAIYGPRGNAEGVQAHARKVILLSGTPTPNNAGELYHHIRTFWPAALPGHGSQPEFEERYCRFKDTTFGRQITGSRNQAQLRAALDEVILRRRKEDVLPELPPLIVQDMPLNPYDAGAVDIDDLDIVEAILPEDEDDLLRELGKLASIRRKLGLAKVTATVAWVQERMESTDKIILFCWHLDVIDQLKMRLLEYGPVTITGATSPSARAAAVNAFQTRPGTRLFIGQILASGVAITLTAASEVAIVEPSWVPGENHQAICRAHRLGQRDSVLASFLYLPDTLDETIMHVFRRKAREIAELEGVS